MASDAILVKTVAVLAEAFGRKATEVTYEAYRLGLADLTDAELQHAAGRAIRELKFMPVPAELRQLSGRATVEDRAILAWSDVERSLHLGPYRHVDFDDRTINATIRSLGGWPTFLARFTGAEAEKWVRQEFLRAYASLARCEVGDEAGEPLAGLAEASIVRGKIAAPPVIKITCKTGSPDGRIGTTTRQAPLIGVVPLRRA